MQIRFGSIGGKLTFKLQECLVFFYWQLGTASQYQQLVKLIGNRSRSLSPSLSFYSWSISWGGSRQAAHASHVCATLAGRDAASGPNILALSPVFDIKQIVYVTQSRLESEKAFLNYKNVEVFYHAMLSQRVIHSSFTELIKTVIPLDESPVQQSVVKFTICPCVF